MIEERGTEGREYGRVIERDERGKESRKGR